MVFKIQGKVGGAKLINHDLGAEVAAAAGKYSFDRLDWLFGLISSVQKSIAFNANRQLALETLMLEMKRKAKANIFLPE